MQNFHHETKFEIRNPNLETNPKFKTLTSKITPSFALFSFRTSVIRICVGFRYSDFEFRLRPSHSRNLRKREDSAHDLFPRQRFDLVNRDRVSDIEPPGLSSAQRF